MWPAALSQPALGGHAGFLGGLLQLRPQSPDLRLLQPRIQGGFQENPPELLSVHLKAQLQEHQRHSYQL